MKKHTEGFQLLQKKYGITMGHSTFATEAIKTRVLICGMFMSASMRSSDSSWAELFDEVGDVQELELRGD